MYTKLRRLQSPPLKAAEFQQRSAIEPFRMDDPIEGLAAIRGEIAVKLDVAVDHVHRVALIDAACQRSSEIAERKCVGPDEHLVGQAVKVPDEICRIRGRPMERGGGNGGLRVGRRAGSGWPVY